MSRQVPDRSLKILMIFRFLTGRAVRFRISFLARGCPFRCAFCTSSAFWGRMRYFSAEYVVREIEKIVDLCGDQVTHLTFMDDLMTLNRLRLQEMATLLYERGLTHRVNFSMAVKAGKLDDDLCRIFKKMNVSDVFFGAESGVDRILRYLKGDIQTVAENQATIDILATHQIPVSLSMIVGVPGETEEDIHQTYGFILRNLQERNIFAASTNILMPMPGTAIWQQAIQMGIFDLRNIEWGRLKIFAYYKNSNIPNLEEWIRIRQENNSYYLNERFVPQEKLLSLMEDYESQIQENCLYP